MDTKVNGTTHPKFGQQKKRAPAFSVEDFEDYKEDDPGSNEEYASKETDPLLQLIDECRIDLTAELPPAPIAMQIVQDGKTSSLFSKGNFSIITGPAKSRKTFLISMLVAASIKGNLQNYLRCPNDGVSIIFDTEQSRYKTQQIGKRICQLTGMLNPKNLLVFSLRTLDPAQRIALIEKVLETTKNINFVAIDGIIDLDIDPILQADQAQNIVQKLMFWTEHYNIHISCVLHFNKTITTLLGHLGSFSHRKADAIISVTKNKDNDAISIVEPVDCREMEFSPFAFSINEQGLPYILDDYVETTSSPAGKKKIIPKDIPESEHRSMVKEIYEAQPSGYNYKELIYKIILKYHEYGIQFGESKAREFISHFQNLKIIVHNGEQGRKAKYLMMLN